MNTDIFGKEERKQMLERIERMELKSSAMMSAITNINETLNILNDKIDGKAKSVEEPTFEAATAMPMPSYKEMQEKRDEEFNKMRAEDREYADAKFEEEMGVLRGIFDKLDKIQNGDEPTEVQDLGSLVTYIEKANHGVNDIYDMGRATLYREEQNGDVLKEIRSGIAETNSLLSAILKKMEEPKADEPPYKCTISCKGSDGDKPYIPEPTYSDSATDREETPKQWSEPENKEE